MLGFAKRCSCRRGKKFDSAANRLGEMENAGALIQNAHKVQKEAEKVEIKAKEQKEQPKEAKDSEKGKPMPEWKKKSLEFRKAMLAAKAAGGDEEAAAKEQELSKELGAAGPAKADPSKTACPHCGRSFNKESAEKHINICLKMFGGKNQRLVKGGGANSQATVQSKAPSGAPKIPSNKAGMPPAAPEPAALQRKGSRGPGQKSRQ